MYICDLPTSSSLFLSSLELSDTQFPIKEIAAPLPPATATPPFSH